MIIGHLPAGYVASKLMFPHFEARGAVSKPFFFFGQAFLVPSRQILIWCIFILSITANIITTPIGRISRSFGSVCYQSATYLANLVLFGAHEE